MLQERPESTSAPTNFVTPAARHGPTAMEEKPDIELDTPGLHNNTAVNLV